MNNPIEEIKIKSVKTIKQITPLVEMILLINYKYDKVEIIELKTELLSQRQLHLEAINNILTNEKN